MRFKLNVKKFFCKTWKNNTLKKHKQGETRMATFKYTIDSFLRARCFEFMTVIKKRYVLKTKFASFECTLTAPNYRVGISNFIK